MTSDLVVCPGCRTREGDRLDVRTIEPDPGGALACECGRRYPIVDGVPILLRDPTAFAANQLAAALERDVPPALAALLLEHGGDDHPYAQLCEHLSIYLDAHWGDRAAPADPTAYAAGALVERLAALPRVARAVELGCSAGRVVAELAAAADHVTAVELHLGALRRARRLLDGEPVTYLRRVAGRHYIPATITPGDRAVPAARRTLLCGDALDPPLLPDRYDRVVALNLLDSVAQPRRLLQVLDALCRRGGELILSSPYAWQGTVLADDERLGAADPAADLVARLRTGTGLGSRYTIEENIDVSWTLRRDARSRVAYRVHLVRARKG